MATAATRKVTMRLPNSIALWMPIARWGPPRAAEAGPREPHDAAGHDDADVGDEQRDGCRPHPGERPGRRSPLHGGPLAHTHSHENVRAVRRVPMAAQIASTRSWAAGKSPWRNERRMALPRAPEGSRGSAPP